jgi:Rod binding domain-containing protein
MEIAKNDTIPPVVIGVSTSSPTTLREATRQFESLFISQLMKSMRATVPESQLMGVDGGQQLFREMLDQELANRVAEAGGIGIGEMLYRQLAPSQPGKVSEGTRMGPSVIAASHPDETRRSSIREAGRSQNHED